MYPPRRWPAASPGEPLCGVCPQSPWTVLIAGSAAELPEKLLEASESPRWLVLETDSSSKEDKLTASMLELLAETVRHRDVEAIVVYGQSKDAASGSHGYCSALSKGTSGYTRLLQRMSARMQGERQAQNRVRVRLNQIRLDARFAAASLLRGVRLCGLYHLAESNAFLRYDHTEDRFLPLAAVEEFPGLRPRSDAMPE